MSDASPDERFRTLSRRARGHWDIASALFLRKQRDPDDDVDGDELAHHAWEAHRAYADAHWLAAGQQPLLNDRPTDAARWRVRCMATAKPRVGLT